MTLLDVVLSRRRRILPASQRLRSLRRPRPLRIPALFLLLALPLSLVACSVPQAAAMVGASNQEQEATATDAAAQPEQTPDVQQPDQNTPIVTVAPPPATATPAPTPKAGTVTVVPILMYHYIRALPPNTPDQLGYGLSIAPKLFEQQLQYLAGAGYTSVSMDALTGHITKGTALPSKPVVLSFDDGYADFYTAAWPLLQQYHFTATVYLVVDFLGKPGYMSWPQAQALRDAGVEIGAHTLDHVDLAIQPLASAKHQISDSGTILRQRLNAPVTTFAYPSGQYNANTVKIVGESGFSSAVTTAFGSRHTTNNLLTLARVRVQGGVSMPNFIKNLNG